MHLISSGVMKAAVLSLTCKFLIIVLAQRRTDYRVATLREMLAGSNGCQPFTDDEMVVSHPARDAVLCSNGMCLFNHTHANLRTLH